MQMTDSAIPKVRSLADGVALCLSRLEPSPPPGRHILLGCRLYQSVCLRQAVHANVGTHPTPERTCACSWQSALALVQLRDEPTRVLGCKLSTLAHSVLGLAEGAASSTYSGVDSLSISHDGIDRWVGSISNCQAVECRNSSICG